MTFRYKKLDYESFEKKIQDTIKITVIGGENTGKTNLIYNLRKGGFIEFAISVKSRTSAILNIDDELVKLDLWEDGYPNRLPVNDYFNPQVALVTIDVTNVNSFIEAKAWVSKQKTIIDLKILLVATKIDATTDRVVTNSSIMEYAESMQIPWIETSVKNNRNVTEAFVKGASLVKNKLPHLHSTVEARTIKDEFDLMNKIIFNQYNNATETSFYSKHIDNTLKTLISQMNAFNKDYLSPVAQLNSEEYHQIADWIKQAIKETKKSHLTYRFFPRMGLTNSSLTTALETYLEQIKPFLIVEEDMDQEETQTLKKTIEPKGLTLELRYSAN